MKKSKQLTLILLCILMMMASVLPVYAADARLSHGAIASCGFDIGSDGWSEITISYSGNTTSFTSFTVEAYIQKRTLGFIWTKVDNGEPNKTWVDSSTNLMDSFLFGLQLDNKGTYRAVYTLTFSGTGAPDDVIEDTIERTYE
ncbi:MAG: hypothetical protein IJW99_11840 [Clostridia bacterium]|nr:hypothetical protein [Clostridia bacterium]